MKYLITGTLLDSYDWLKSCPKNWKAKAYEDFASVIRRCKQPPSEACLRGIEFEKLICERCNSLDEEAYIKYVRAYYENHGVKGYEVDMAMYTTCNIAKQCRGGEQQVQVKKDIIIGGEEYHLFGYADVVFPDEKIIDIKTTGKYKGGYSYVKRSQHYIYSLCTGINTFKYLIADYKESKIPRDLHQVEFEMTQDENLWVLEKRIEGLMNYIKNEGLFDDYCNIYSAQRVQD